MVPLMKWALAHPCVAPAAFRRDAAGLLRWQDLEAAPAFLEALKIETDPGVAEEMAQAMRGMEKPGMAADLVAAARFQAGNPDTLRRLLDPSPAFRPPTPTRRSRSWRPIRTPS